MKIERGKEKIRSTDIKNGRFKLIFNELRKVCG